MTIRSGETHVVLTAAAILAVASVLLAPAASLDAAVGVNWTPDTLQLTVYPGSSQGLTLQFEATSRVDSTSVLVVPTIGRFLAVDAAGLATIEPRVRYALPARLTVPAGTPLGVYEGTVHVRSRSRTVPGVLKVVLTVAPPSAAVVPDDVTLPSPDRIGSTPTGVPILRDEIAVVVGFEAAEPDEIVRAAAAATGSVILGARPRIRTYQLQVPAADYAALESFRGRLESQPGISGAFLHYLTVQPLVTPRYPDDKKYDSWDESTPAGNNWGLEYIKAPSAWNAETGSRDVTVGIIDFDFDERHPDLEPNVVSHQAGGFHPIRTDHGNHVSGTACAQGNNGRGVTGVSWECSLRLYDVADPWLSSPLSLSKAMELSADDGASVVNISIGAAEDTNSCPAPALTHEKLVQIASMNALYRQPILYALKEKKDVLWVFAAGNECRDARHQSPAGLSFEFPLNTLTVAAVELPPSGVDSGVLRSSSNFGSRVSVAAPGGNIYSTLRPGTCVPFTSICSDLGAYGPKSGTSMAAPHVTGLAALVKAAHPDYSAERIKRCIVSGARVAVSGHSFRVIDASAAVECKGTLDLPDQVDIVFALDLTGSMTGAIQNVKENVAKVMNGLRAAAPATDFTFGVVSYEDYPGVIDSRSCSSAYVAEYGAAGTKPGGDAPFRIDRTLTGDADSVSSAVSGLALGWGGDGPQSYGRVFWEVSQADTGGQLNFRPGALKLIISFGDNVPHDPDLNQGVPGVTGRYDTGADPGRNGKVDCGPDDIDFQDGALAALRAAEVRLIHVDSSGSGAVGQYWTSWTAETGGTFAAINPDGSIPGGLDLTQLVVSLIGAVSP